MKEIKELVGKGDMPINNFSATLREELRLITKDGIFNEHIRVQLDEMRETRAKEQHCSATDPSDNDLLREELKEIKDLMAKYQNDELKEIKDLIAEADCRTDCRKIPFDNISKLLRGIMKENSAIIKSLEAELINIKKCNYEGETANEKQQPDPGKKHGQNAQPMPPKQALISLI